MANWLDKYEQGGLVLKQKTKDNYGKKPNPNDVTVSSGPNYVGMGNDITGRDYSPAWGGQFQSGGFLQPISYKLPSRYRIPYAEPSTELATSIGGVNGEPAYLIPTFKGGKDLKDPVDEYRKTGEHLGGPFKTWQEAEKWEQEIRHPYVEKGKPIPTPLKRWGDMEDGGYVAQKGKSIPVPTTADSARLFNAQTALNNFYAKEMKAGRIRRKSVDNTLPGDPNISSSGLKGLNKDNLDFYRAQIKTRNERKEGMDDEYYERYFKFSPEQVRDLENKGLGQTKGSSEYQQYYRDMVTPMQNLAAPFALIDSRIAPQREIRYEPTTFDYPGGDVMVYDYDPLAIKPYHMRTDKEKIEWEKKYGKGTPITGSIKKPITSTGKSKIEPEKKKTSVIKKSEETKTKETKLTKPTKTEETKPAPYTPTGSKKYIVNGMEVSEEDFLGSGNTTGGSKRIIYNTPKLGTQKVLRLDGTPETDPDKIRKAMRAQEKDSDMAMGGSLPGAVGFTYARVAGSAPANGKYTKKTKASAQNGKEMKFYQEGFDFKPNSIAQDGAIVDPMGQWAHPGEVTIIPGTDITMEGVDYPVLGISDTGDTQMMYPGEDYDFDGDYVTEYPMMKSGGWLSKYQSGGPLSRSNLEMMSTLQKDIKKQKDKKGRELLVEAANAAKNKRETVKQDNRTSREKEVAQQEVLKLKMNEARGSSPFTQTLSSFTPTGSNQAAGQIAAENIGQMTPMMGATRLFTTAMDPKNNPYGISKNNGWLDNTFGILGLVGDYLDVGAVTTPAIASGLKRFTNKPSSKVNQLDNSGRIAVETVDPETGESKFIYQLDDSPIANNYVYKPKPAKASDFTSFSTKIGDKIESISNKILNVLNNTSNYKRPLGSLEAYKNWAKLIHPELQYVDPKIIKQIHKEGIKTLNKTSGLSKVENPSRHLGLYIRDRLADKIPSFADPVVTHPTSGKFINYGPEQLHPNVLSKEELPIFEQIYAGDEDSKLWSHLRDLNKIPVRDWGYDIGKLTAQENNLVNAYAHGYDEIMNARNTGEISFNTSKFYQDKAEALNQAIQKNKFPEATSVRRGTRDYTVELLDPVTFKPTGKTVLKSELGAGDVFKDEAFLSTSIDLNSSIGNPIASEIVEIPGGGKQSYAYPNAVSSSPFPNEMEAVLPRGLVRRVEEVRPSTVDEFSNVKFPNNAKFRTKILNPYNLLLPLGGAALFGKEEKENGGWLTKYK